MGRAWVPFVVLVALGAAAIALATCVGAMHVPFSHVLGALGRRAADPSDWESLLVLRVRLPRAVVAYLVGGHSP